MALGKILIVDDDRTAVSVMKLYVTSLGYQVAGVAYSTRGAIDIAQKIKPDLVLIDIRFGAEVDGIDAALVMGKCMDILIVFVTAHLDQKIIKRAKIAGPSGFINKPIRISDLNITLALALNSKQKKVSAKDMQSLSMEQVLREVYRLTPAESRVTMMICRYPELTTVACALNIKVSTLRTHLKHIYRKTNTNSKAMLIRELQSRVATDLVSESLDLTNTIRQQR